MDYYTFELPDRQREFLIALYPEDTVWVTWVKGLSDSQLKEHYENKQFKKYKSGPYAQPMPWRYGS